MTERSEQELVEQLLDILVFAPLGLALDARELVPKLAERGRNHIDLMRVAGTMAARHSGGEAKSLVESFVDLVIDRVRAVSGDDRGSTDSPSAESADTAVGRDEWAVAVLARPAREIVSLLSTFAPAELVVLRTQETAGKARVTVLREIERLLG